MRSYFDAIFRYADFSGRTSRAQYWIFQLVMVLILAATALIEFRFTGIPTRTPYPLPISSLLSLFHTIPSMAVTIRRLHDIGRSGWWFLLGAVPVLGLIVIFWTCCASEDGDNDFGNPNVLASTGPQPRPGAIPPGRLAAARGHSLANPQFNRLAPRDGRFI